MKIRSFPYPIFLAFITIILTLIDTTNILATTAQLQLENTPDVTPEQKQMTAALQNTSIMFIENVGQFDKDVRFQARGVDHTIWLLNDAIWITCLGPAPVNDANYQLPPFPDTERNPPIMNRQGINIRLSFVGSSPQSHLEPFSRMNTQVSYFIGNDSNKRQSNAPVWSGVRYVDIYPGINLEITGENGQIVQRLVVTENAVPRTNGHWSLKNVRLQIDGADSLALSGNHLQLTTAIGKIALPLLEPIAANGEPLEFMETDTSVQGNEIIAPFPTGHSLHRTLFPQDNSNHLLYSTFLGGSDIEGSSDIAIDGAGNAYITGWTWSYDFPTTLGVFDTGYNGWFDVFVAKMNADGTELAYATFLGSNNWDESHAIAVDQAGNAYITGFTTSYDFPITSGSFDTSHNGSYDAFVVKLNTSGTELVYATFLGGTSSDEGHDIAVDETGNAYVTGETNSSNFPSTVGAFDNNYNGGYPGDAFAIKLNSMGTGLFYGTFLGGTYPDRGYGISIDSAGNSYVTGHTSSPDFPTTPGAFDTNRDSHDAFVVKLNASGTGLAYSTFLGGSEGEGGEAITVDQAGNAYVTGYTDSSDFPITPGTFDTSYNDTCVGEYCLDIFVAKLNESGTRLTYSTYLGGNDNDKSADIALDGEGNAYVTGFTSSSDFPVTPEAFDTSHGGGTCGSIYEQPYPCADAFVVKVNSGGTGLVYSTFLGGEDGDGGSAIAVNDANSIYVVGGLSSSDFPTTAGAYDTSYNGSSDVFVTKLTEQNIWQQVVPTSLYVANNGDVLTYTVNLIYPNNPPMVFYDQVPLYTSYISNTLNAPAGVVYNPVTNVISGALNLSAAVSTTISFAVSVEVTGTAEFAPLIVNRACVYPAGGGLTDCDWSNEVFNFTYIWPVYLPIVRR